jgi:hypothetical protein
LIRNNPFQLAPYHHMLLDHPSAVTAVDRETIQMHTKLELLGIHKCNFMPLTLTPPAAVYIDYKLQSLKLSRKCSYEKIPVHHFVFHLGF